MPSASDYQLRCKCRALVWSSQWELHEKSDEHREWMTRDAKQKASLARSPFNEPDPDDALDRRQELQFERKWGK